MAAAMIGMLFWATPIARRHTDLLVIGAMWLSTTVPSLADSAAHAPHC